MPRPQVPACFGFTIAGVAAVIVALARHAVPFACTFEDYFNAAFRIIFLVNS